MAQYSRLRESTDIPSRTYDDHDSGSSVCENDIFLEKSALPSSQKPFRRLNLSWIIVHTLLIASYLAFFLATWGWTRPECPYGVYGPGLVYSRHAAFHIAMDIAADNFV